MKMVWFGLQSAQGTIAVLFDNAWVSMSTKTGASTTCMEYEDNEWDEVVVKIQFVNVAIWSSKAIEQLIMYSALMAYVIGNARYKQCILIICQWIAEI